MALPADATARLEALGRSRGGRTTKIHALTNAFCRPIAFLVIGGQLADCAAAHALLERMPATSILHGDKDHDSNAARSTAAPGTPRLPCSHLLAKCHQTMGVNVRHWPSVTSLRRSAFVSLRRWPIVTSLRRWPIVTG